MRIFYESVTLFFEMIRDNGFARAPMAQGWTARTGRPPSETRGRPRVRSTRTRPARAIISMAAIRPVGRRNARLSKSERAREA